MGVKRYTPDDHEGNTMHECADGDYVRYEDYATLEAERAERERQEPVAWQWTPGPWVAQPDPHGTSGDWCIGVGDQIDRVAVCSAKDARLIAAAPELVGALSVIVDYLGSTAECGYDPFAADPLIGSARAALAKAGVK